MVITPFQWKFIFGTSFLFFAFSLSMVVITLLLVYEIRDHDCMGVDDIKLRFVEIGNWLFASFIAISLIISFGGWKSMQRIMGNFDPNQKLTLDLTPADLSRHKGL